MSSYDIVDCDFTNLEIATLASILIRSSHSYDDAVLVMSSVNERSATGLAALLHERFGGGSREWLSASFDILENVIGSGREYELFCACSRYSNSWTREQTKWYNECFAHFH
jgi:hypothetical protein